jgi:hypothetical protein
LNLLSIEQLDQILDRITDRAETNTAIVKSQPVRRRLPPLGLNRTGHARRSKAEVQRKK